MSTATAKTQGINQRYRRHLHTYTNTHVSSPQQYTKQLVAIYHTPNLLNMYQILKIYRITRTSIQISGCPRLFSFAVIFVCRKYDNAESQIALRIYKIDMGNLGGPQK